MGELDGRTAIVTGAAQGIGRAVATHFAREGADVGVVDLDEDGAAETARELAGLGIKSHGVAADVGDEGAVKRAFGALTEGLGDADILVNNAGISTFATVLEMPTDQWDEMIRVNLRSMFLCSRQVLPAMRGRKWGRIINVSSNIAQKGGSSQAHYAASKAGVLGFTRALAREVAREGITVNALCPASVDTPMARVLPKEWFEAHFEQQPLGRFAHVDEIAPSAVLMASDAGAYYTGVSMNMNGGDVMI